MSVDRPFIELHELVEPIADGCFLAIPKDESGVAMAATRALIRRGVKGLRLLCAPVCGLQADLLIGAGCVASVECGAITINEIGVGPRFRAAVQAGAIEIRDSTCPAIHAGLQAGEKGLPFVAMRGIIGSDLLDRLELTSCAGNRAILSIAKCSPDMFRQLRPVVSSRQSTPKAT